MDAALSKEYLTDEDKFLCQLEKNLYDQLNKLKVEELSLLKLIKSRKNDPLIQAETTSQELLEIDQDDLSDNMSGNDNVPTNASSKETETLISKETDQSQLENSANDANISQYEEVANEHGENHN